MTKRCNGGLGLVCVLAAAALWDTVELATKLIPAGLNLHPQTFGFVHSS